TMDARERLTRAAVEALKRFGHAKASVKKIAALAGVNHGLVHHYFGSKETLMAKALMGMVSDVTQRTRIRISAEEGRVYLPPIFSDPDLLKVMLEFLALSRDMPEVKAALKEMVRSRHGILKGMFGTDDPVAPAIFLGGMFGLAMQYQVDESLPVAEAAGRLLGLVLTDLDPVRFPPGGKWQVHQETPIEESSDG
ncbi:MAG: TetR family transcriptional regulator, partial [bacterium]